MATFEPPTHTEYFAPPGADRLWSRVSYRRGNTVLVADETITTLSPEALVVGSDAVIAAEASGYAFLGSTSTTFLDIDTETLLVTAGYEDNLVGEDYPAALL